jgi:hypothetical protein
MLRRQVRYLRHWSVANPRREKSGSMILLEESTGRDAVSRDGCSASSMHCTVRPRPSCRPQGPKTTDSRRAHQGGTEKTSSR